MWEYLALRPCDFVEYIVSELIFSTYAQYASRPPGTNGPPGPPPNPAAMYPWSQRRLTFTSNIPPPFPRYGAAVNSLASKEGDIYLMGGLISGTMVKGDLWMVEAGSGSLACYPVGTTFEGPCPRVGHASLLVGNAFIIFGGDTKIEESDQLDDTLYLLNTCKLLQLYMNSTIY